MATAAPRCSRCRRAPAFSWSVAAGTERDVGRHLDGGGLLIAGRSVVYLSEEKETPV